MGVRGYIKAGLCGLCCSGLFGIALTLTMTVAAGAAPLVVKVQGATMVADPHTHKLALDILVRPASRQAFDRFMAQHAGQKIAVLVYGRTTLTTVARRPAASGTMEIAGAPVAAMRELIGQLSMRHAKIAIDVAPN